MRALDRGRTLFAGLAGTAVFISGLGIALTGAWAADAPSPSAVSLAPNSETLLLEVEINGFSTGKIADVVQQADGKLLIKREDLTELGLRVPSTVAATTDSLYALDSLPNVSARIDSATQTLYITAPDSALLTKLLIVRPRELGGPPTESGTGLTFNYDVNAAETDGQPYGSGMFEARVFSPFGAASTDFLAFAGSPFGGPVSPPIRLDSTYVYSDYNSQNQYSFGDFITGGLAWNRPVRLGGAQATRDFTMRPDLITFPVPTVTGTAAVPSTVDVLINGMRAFSEQVAPGPFEVTQLPVITGAGNVQMTVTNALGQQVTTSVPFYASSDLLAPELYTYSLEGGFVRRDWGALSDDYGNFAGSGTYRRGLNDYLTLEAHGEATQGLGMAGGGVVANLFNLALLNLGGAGSDFQGHGGGELAVGLQRIGPIFSFGAQAELATRKFGDIAATEGDPVAIRRITASIDTSLGKIGSVGLAWAQIDQPGQLFLGSVGSGPSITPPGPPGPQPGIGPEPFVPGQISEILTGNYSVQLFRMAFLYANAFHDFVQGGTGATLGITIMLGERDSVTASGNYSSGSPLLGEFQAQRSVSEIGDLGYQAYASTDNHEFGWVQYKSPWGLFTGGLDHLGGETTIRGEAQGALSYIDNQVFPTNTVTNSFAVVDTNGVGNVHVSYENRPAGVTDDSGKLLVPDLLPWYNNHVAIDPADVPVDAQVPSVEQTVRPPDLSGVVVNFRITKTKGAVLVLVDEAGKPVPLGSTATLEATSTVVPVGYDGEAFVENLGAQNRVDVQLPDGSQCVVSFGFTAADGEIPRIGPLTCSKQSQ